MLLVHFIELFVAAWNTSVGKDSVASFGLGGKEFYILLRLPWSKKQSSHKYIDDPSLDYCFDSHCKREYL